jgi:hypothetical protein
MPVAIANVLVSCSTILLKKNLWEYIVWSLTTKNWNHKYQIDKSEGMFVNMRILL